MRALSRAKRLALGGGIISVWPIPRLSRRRSPGLRSVATQAEPGSPGERAGIRIVGAAENNLRDVTVALPTGISAIVGVSGSGKSSLAFDTLYHEARRRYFEALSLGSPWLRTRPARVRSIAGLAPAVAVAQNVLNRNPNSTIATASGIHPYLRLLYARFAERRCAECGAETQVTSVEHQLATLRHLIATQVRPVEVVAPLVRRAEGAHARLLEWLSRRWARDEIEVDGRAWNGRRLNPDVPHDITARIATVSAGTEPRALREALEMVTELGSPQVVLRTGPEALSLTRAALCPRCGHPFRTLEPEDFNRGDAPIETYRLAGLTLPELLRRDVSAAAAAFEHAAWTGGARTASDQVLRRLAALMRVGLGYLALDRPSPSLSRGEAQRLRIALILANPIEDLIHVLDEPTIGLDPGQMSGILAQVARLRGPVLMVEHDRWAVAAADHVVELGPGAGEGGGRVVFEGVPAHLWPAETVSGRWFASRDGAGSRGARSAATDSLRLRSVSLNNLADLDISIPLGRLTVVAGPSGAGKTTLVRDVLVRSLAAGEPVGCVSVDGPPLRPITVTQEPIGRNARSSAATYTGLADQIRRLFAEATGEPPARYSFNRPEGACRSCDGIGSVEIKLPYVPSEWLTCQTCEGRRFRPEALRATVRLRDGVARSIAEVYELSVDAAGELMSEHSVGRQILGSLQAVGLGYLPLGQPSPTLSGGEAQRIKLAKWLAMARAGDLLALDEPTTGLHPADVVRLLEVLHGLVERGCTVVVVEHQPDVIAAADWLLRLGPGGGPEGGRLLYTGRPAGAATRIPRTQPRAAPRRRPRTSAAITIAGASVNNLRNLSVSIAKNAITGVVGVSGSGKSSLVRDVLGAEAVRRFVESLSMYERQSVREGAEPSARRIEGLGPTLAIGAESRRDALATVGLATELSFHLGVLLAFAGFRDCPQCGEAQRRATGPAGLPWRCEACGAEGPSAEPQHFSPSTYAAACLVCHGVGTAAEPRLERLIVDPNAPITAGAMYSPGYFPQGYLSKPDSLGHWMLQALGERYGFDPGETPWRQLTPEARDAFLNADEEIEVHVPAGAGRKAGRRTIRWRGVLRIVAGWDLGGMYVDHVPCPACDGGRLRPEFLGVRLGTMNRRDLHTAPIGAIDAILGELIVPPGVPHWVEQSRTVARRRIGFLDRVGLDHLHLDRLSRTLSAGETQRVKLASLLGAELSGMTVLLDEPTRGLHPREVDALAEAIAELRDGGNTIVLVDHDPRLLARVDQLVVLGPDAGVGGGRLLAAGPASTVRRIRRTDVRSVLASPLPRRVRGPRRAPRGGMLVRGPVENTLDGRDIEIPLGIMTGLCGVSGSGKSTLAIGIVARALAPVRLTTSVAYDDIRPGAHAGIDGAPGRVIHSDQSRSGIHTPGAFLSVMEPLRKAYAGSAEAAARGLEVDDLAPDCDACHGRGQIREEMGFLPSIDRPCDACDATGYRLEIRDLVVRGGSLPSLARTTLDEVLRRWADVERIAGPLEMAASLGLGYLTLGQPSHSLSGGEAQRLKLARELARPTRRPTLYILDEPTVGLHLRDVSRLADVLDGLVERGHSVLVVEHDPVLLACCDHLIELGPGGGPDGGHLIAAGSPEKVAAGDTPTARYLREVLA